MDFLQKQFKTRPKIFRSNLSTNETIWKQNFQIIIGGTFVYGFIKVGFIWDLVI